MVNVSEGEVAVVCLQGDFSNIFSFLGDEEEEVEFQLNVTLIVEDLQTSKCCMHRL